MNFSWTTAFKIAWRESRSSSFKFLFVILAVAVGVGSLTGVRGFSRAFHDMLLSQARTLMAADLSLRVFELPTPQQTAVMDALAKSRRRSHLDHRNAHHGLRRASRSRPCWSPSKPSIRRVYPFYGEIRYRHPPPLCAARLPPTPSPFPTTFCLRLNLKVGDTLAAWAANLSASRAK